MFLDHSTHDLGATAAWNTTTINTGQMAGNVNAPDLRALIDFLHSDDRPSAILPITDRSIASVTSAPALTFQNAAFESLRIAEDELQEVLAVVAQRGAELDKSDKPRRLEIGGGSWSIRAVSPGYVLLIYHGISQQISQTALNGTSAQQQKQRPVQAAPHDWTRHAVPNLPPWTEYVRTFDWASTGLGPMQGWSTPLRKFILMVMNNPSPRLLVWGRSRTFIYNDACSPLFGSIHPGCLGKPVSVVWADIWDHISPVIEAGYAGKVSQMARLALPMERHGFMEETYWDFTLLPVTDGNGNIEGILDEITESTITAVGERRRASLMKVTESIPSAKTLSELWTIFCRALNHSIEDIPYVLLYSKADRTHHGHEDPHPHNSHGLELVLESAVGIDCSSHDVCRRFGLDAPIAGAPDLDMIEPCLKALSGKKSMLVTAKDGTLPQSLQVIIPDRAFGSRVESAFIAPLITSGQGPLGVMIVGLNPRRPFDDEYQLYMDVITDVLTKAASLIALPEEQRCTQEMADEMNIELSHQLRLITRQAERTEARFSRMSASAPFGMFVFDPDGRPLHINEAYLTMTRQTKEEFASSSTVAASWRDRIHPEDLVHFETQWDRIKKLKVPITIEYRLQKPWIPDNGPSGPEMKGETWLLANAFPDVDTNGEIVSIQGWLTDISHRKFTEQLLARKLEDALENKRQTENFIDMTSHEMRNPLSAILQSADSIVSTLKSSDRVGVENVALLPANVADEVADAAQTIILCAQHQKRIVDDILTLSKLDASLLIISPDASHPPSLIYKALKMYEADMARSDIRATLVLEQSYETLGIDWVVLDSSRLLQVVINLLTNAIKFTQFSEKREIVVTVGASYEKPSGHHHGVEFIPPRHSRPNPTLLEEWGKGEELYLQVAVSDTGRGLNDEELQLLFQRFSQASPKTYGQYGGSGLGLFISRELCELQGGQIGVSSTGGKTTFTFFVRAKRSVPSGPPEITRPTIPDFLSCANSPIVFHRRGSVAVGDAIAGLARDTSKAQEVRVPTRTMSDETKPLARQAAASATQDASDLHVLIVEDNLINQKVMSQQLRRAGCTVHIANHGQECLDFLHRTSFLGNSPSSSLSYASGTAAHSPSSPFDPTTPNTTDYDEDEEMSTIEDDEEDEDYDDDDDLTDKDETKDANRQHNNTTTAPEPAIPLSVILLDLEMPTMDGLTCIREIRRLQGIGNIASHVPVIAVTANARSEQIAVALDAGMDSVVTKPFRIPELVPQIHALVADVATRKRSAG